MKWEELTSSDFEVAVKKCEGICVVPLGVIEKHGPHLPLGTDFFNISKVATLAAEKEPAIVFPPYYFTEIYEAQCCPGAIAIKPRLLIELLENVCDEISRNNLKKILLLNGHGGNKFLLPFFIQTMLYRKKDYLVYLSNESWFSSKMVELREEIMETKELGLGHADESETSNTLVTYPYLVKMDRIPKEPGISLDRLKHLPKGLSTPLDWYACYPEHYAGDARSASKEKGEKILEKHVDYVVELIKAVKKDNVTKNLYDDFFSRVE